MNPFRFFLALIMTALLMGAVAGVLLLLFMAVGWVAHFVAHFVVTGWQLFPWTP